MLALSLRSRSYIQFTLTRCGISPIWAAAVVDSDTVVCVSTSGSALSQARSVLFLELPSHLCEAVLFSPSHAL